MKKKSGKLPKYLTTVTPFSKFLALSMLVLFPIFGFYFGKAYEKATAPRACWPTEQQR